MVSFQEALLACIGGSRNGGGGGGGAGVRGGGGRCLPALPLCGGFASGLKNLWLLGGSLGRPRGAELRGRESLRSFLLFPNDSFFLLLLLLLLY